MLDETGDPQEPLERLARGQLERAVSSSLPKKTRRNHARQLARVEYIQNSGQCSIRDLWKRQDRPYRELWTLAEFTAMAAGGKWSAKRDTFWADVNAVVEKHTKQELARQLLEETRMLKDGLDALAEYMMPMREDDGSIKRHGATFTVQGKEVPNPYEGLPVFALEMGRYDQTAPSFLKIYAQLTANRQTIEGTNKQGIGGDGDGASPMPPGMPMPPPEAIAEMSRQLVRSGQVASMDEFQKTDLPGDETGADHDDLDDGFDDKL